MPKAERSCSLGRSYSTLEPAVDPDDDVATREGNGLENRRTLKRSVGSNPTPSAYFKPFAASQP
jgi:hypothetical protein